MASSGQAAQSANYKMLPNIVDPGGKRTVSANYDLSFAAGIVNQRQIAGTAYLAYPGFFFPVTITIPPEGPAFIRTEDRISPTIEAQISGNENMLWSNDPIPAEATFLISISDNVELDRSSIVVRIDGVVKISANNYLDFLDPAKVQGEKTAIYLTCSASLAPGQHTIYIEARDVAKNPASRQYTGLEVAAPGSEPEIKAGTLVVSPTTFSPATGGKTTIAFSVASASEDTDVTVYVHGVGGLGSHWTRKLRSKAGYNQVVFDGKSDVSGEPMANGIYVVKIISNGKEIGKQYIVIFSGNN
ncbi:MAG: hypothetical protein KKC80_08290 [Candidatus Margulisbacteria bacterium]|nr:hypothetical protein [Candidatus Margulisiibacteriota bacterium]MBU1617689.1 hypothetical protein [Candidatus Margulisiibacteriota bacterium]MBU1867080.1 hypothetical protein [Candidatus Margulisiibacteriota bacterium]